MFESIKDWFWNRSIAYDLRKAGIKAEIRKGSSFADAIKQLAEEEAAQQGVQADNCPRCGGRGEVRNEGFVWVACPVCDGAGIAAKA